MSLLSLIIILLFHQPVGDIHLQASVDHPTVQLGGQILVVAQISSALPRTNAPWPTMRFVSPPDPSVWQTSNPEITSDSASSQTKWRLTALKPGNWRLPDIACAFTRADLPFSSSALTLRLVSVDPITILEPVPESRLTSQLLQTNTPALSDSLRLMVALTRLFWITPPLFIMGWALVAWKNWPADPDARRFCWRHWLEIQGLPTGRHTVEGITALLLRKKWRQSKVDQVTNSWRNPSEGAPLPHPNGKALWGWLFTAFSGLLLAGFLVACFCPVDSPSTKTELAQADQFWKQGETEQAMAIYSRLYFKFCAQAYQRLDWAGESVPNLPKRVFLFSLAWLTMWLAFFLLGWWQVLLFALALLAFLFLG